MAGVSVARTLRSFTCLKTTVVRPTGVHRQPTLRTYCALQSAPPRGGAPTLCNRRRARDGLFCANYGPKIASTSHTALAAYSSGSDGVPQISCEEAQMMMEADWEYLDVRTKEEFEEYRIEGSVNVPLHIIEFGGMAPNADFVAQVEAAFPDKSTKFLLGCKAGVRSMQAAQLMSNAGYTEMVNVAPGMMGWVGSGLPYTSGPVETK